MIFSLNHLPYWIVLAIGILLFLMVIFTVGGETDVEGDLGADVEAEVEVESDFSVAQVVDWLGFGRAPLLLLLATDLSLFGVSGWLLNVLAGAPTGFWAGVVFAIATVIALAGGSLIARPLEKIFAQFGEDVSADRLIGCIGTVSSAMIPTVADRRIGQVDVLDAAHNQVTISTALPDWARIHPRRGEQVLVIERQANYYLVIAKDSPDQDTWFGGKGES